MKGLWAGVLCGCLISWLAQVHAESYYPLRLDDPQAIYLTKDQFEVHADGIGDDANAIQQAIDRLQEANRIGVVFIPEGRYRLGKTVYVWEGIRLIGYGKRRPVFILGKNTPGFQDGTGKYMVHFAGYRPVGNRPFSDASEVSFYSGISNIDFQMEEGNPAAIAIRFHVAQHSFLRHMNIHVGSCKAAMEDIGNQASDIHIYGGEYGIITKRTAPVWQFLLMDASFEGQRTCAIHTMEAGFTLVRVRFLHMPVAIQIQEGQVEQLYGRDLWMQDVSLAALKAGNVQNTHSQITLRNVACTDVPTFYRGDKVIPGPAQHYMVDRFMIGLQIGPDGRERGITMQCQQRPLPQPAMAVPSDIPALPPIDRWVNIKALGVKGDGKTDDTEALRAAIERERVLFLPSGTYRVSGSIELKPDTVLIGLHPGTTVIRLTDGAPGFSGDGAPIGVLVAPKGGRNIVLSIGIAPGANRRAAGVVWMAGENSMLDDVSFPSGRVFGLGSAENPIGPDLLIKDGGGGIFRGDWPHCTNCMTAGLRIEDTSARGRVYQMSVEHHMRVEVQLRNVHNWEFYALQTEEENPAGHQAIAMEIQNCSNLLFANTFMYRVSRTTLPKTFGVVVRDSDNIRFENMKVFSQTRLAFDNAVLDETSGVAVRAHFYTDFVVDKSLKLPTALPLPAVFDKDAKLERLADGFSNVSGLASSDTGQLFCTDAAMRRIYRWDQQGNKAQQIATLQGQPMVMGFVSPSQLLIVVNERAVYSLNITDNNAIPEPVTGVSQRMDNTILLLPVGLHNMLSVLTDLMEHRDYLYRPGSNTAVIRVIENAPRSYFYAPGSRTAIFAGGTWRPLLQSSNLAAFAPGDERCVVSEDDGRTYKVRLNKDGHITARLFAERGGTSVVEDIAGNVYIASDQVYIYDASGKQIGILEIPQRPSSLAFGGPDRRTLFIGARDCLYSIRTVVPGR